MEVAAFLSQTGKGNLGMLPGGGDYTNLLLDAEGQVSTYHSKEPMV